MFAFNSATTTVVGISVLMATASMTSSVSVHYMSSASENASSTVDEEECRQVLLNGHIAEGWVVSGVLPVNLVIDENDLVIAGDDLVGVYGTGASSQEALADYISSLLEYHDLLAERSDPQTQALFRHVDTLIHRC